jgi:hypothetical protein
MDEYENTGNPKPAQKYKVWRQKSEVLRASEELIKCHVDAKLVNICKALFSGKSLDTRDLIDGKDENNSTFRRGNEDLILSIPQVGLSVSETTIEFKSLSVDNGKSYHFVDPQLNDKYLEPNKTVDNLFRTILPAHNDQVKASDGKILTPLTIIFPTGEPIVEHELDETGGQSNTVKKVTSYWKHLVINPKQTFANGNESLPFAQRLSTLFVVLGITSMRTEQTNKSNLFEEICSLNSFLKDHISVDDGLINLKNGSTVSTELNYFSKELRKLKYSKDYKFKYLQIQKSRVNDPDCAWRDIDKISSALANLSVLTSATALTFYVNRDNDSSSSDNGLPPSPYLVVPETIHDMFLDARDFCDEKNKYYTCLEHGGASRRKILKKHGINMSVSEEKILESRDRNFRRNTKNGSISGKIPNLKNGWISFEGAEHVKITNFRTSLGFDTCYLFNDKFDTEGTKFFPKLIITPPIPYRYKWVDI